MPALTWRRMEGGGHTATDPAGTVWTITRESADSWPVTADGELLFYGTSFDASTFCVEVEVKTRRAAQQ